MVELPRAWHTALGEGKPNLAAPAPKAFDGKPDVSGVWKHEATTEEESKRLFGRLEEAFAAVDVPEWSSAPQIRLQSLGRP